MITTARPFRDLKRMIQAFQDGGGEGKRLVLKADLSYDTRYEEAQRGAYEQWRYPLLSSQVLAELKTTDLFDAVASCVPVETVEQSVKISADLSEFVDWIGELAALGFEKIILHNVNRKQEQYIDAFGREVLPHLKNNGSAAKAP